jgi:hypothetical protein
MSILKTNVDTEIGAQVAMPQQVIVHQQRRGCLGRLFSSLLWMFIFVALVFFALMFGRQWYDSILAHLDYNKSVHPDGSLVETGVHAQVRPTVTLIYQTKNGKRVRVIADAQDYSEFVNQQVAVLEKQRALLLVNTDKRLDTGLTAVFDKMRGRVERFADWYFSYTTTYKILWEATTSATKHVFSAEGNSLSDAVSYDVEKYLHGYYENIVLRPEITDPQLQTTYRSTLQAAHADYMTVLSKMRADFQVFVSKYTNHLEKPAAKNTQLKLDWESQFNKFNVANYEKGPKGAAVGAVLAIGGAAMGKLVAGAAGKGVAGKAVTGAVGKSIFAKLSTPFVSKAVLAGSGGALGTLAGPIGTVVGALGGLGVDYAINEGVELTQRESFVSDVREALTITQDEWQQQIQKSLHDAINIWIDDTIQLLPRYEI